MTKEKLTILFVPYLASSLMVIGMTLIFSMANPFLGLVNISLLYLIPILFSAVRWGTLPAIITGLMTTVAYDLFFVIPFFKFIVADPRYLISFAIFMLVGLITGTLSDRLKKQINNSQQREKSISALYSLSRDIAAVDNLEAVLDCIVSNVSKTLEGQVVLLLANEKAQLVLRKNSECNNFLDEHERSVATWVYEKGLKAGHGTETWSTAKALYLPLSTEQRTQGVLGININNRNAQLEPKQIRLLEAFTGLADMAINRVILAEHARESNSLVESERLRTDGGPLVGVADLAGRKRTGICHIHHPNLNVRDSSSSPW